MPDGLRSILRRLATLTVVSAVAWAQAACHRGSSPSATERFGPPVSVEGPLEAPDAYPSDAASSVFSVIADEGASGGEIVISIEAISETDRWRVSYRRADEDAPFREDILARTDDGAVMIETTEFDRDALTVYDPPLTLMPPSLNPGEPFEQEVSMIVHPPNDRDTVKRRGMGRQFVELVDAQSVGTDSGRIDAVRVRSRFEADLAPARVESMTERWYAPDRSAVGFIAERYDETLYIFGMESSTRGHLWIRRSNE